ncbi:MAG: UDP-glucose 6-dehydrogenase, partial [Omnitrophica bacterium RIFCSPHIGHO2_02_FULL_63_14]
MVSGACFASLGNTVICVDNNAKKIALLKAGRMPIFEPGLEEMVREGVRMGSLSFTTDLSAAARAADILFIAVGTPPLRNGDADLSAVKKVARAVARQIDGYKLIVEKSTVPVRTSEWVKQTIRRYAKKGAHFDVASNPEFLREGSAIHDFMHPDRVVLGAESERARQILTDLYSPLKCPVFVTDVNTAEIIKHASNSFLAAKISFINAISVICEKAGADVEQVAIGMGMDRRIGRDFLNAGIGFGGFCFPKDLAAFIRISKKLGYDFRLLKEVQRINDRQRTLFVNKLSAAVKGLKGKRIGVLGLAFKPNTDDMRYAPSLGIV